MRVFVVVTLALISTSCRSQANPQTVPQAPVTFEVAAIRSNNSGDNNTQIAFPKGGRLVVANATVMTLMRNAYGLLPFQLGGVPSWLDKDHYDINARTDDSVDITQDNLKQPLQKLLADRFHLKVHWETREEPIYRLTTEKTGPKFQLHTDAPGHGMNTRKTSAEVLMRGTAVPMSELAYNLGMQLSRYVVDQTGLPGQYDFDLNWGSDQLPDSAKPSLFTAIRQQLGLRLEPGKGPMQVLVIDSVEKPSEN
jgi:uncharacterized protein (TIGR03435 family)